MLNKKGSMLPLPYETLMKVIIALVFIIIIVGIIVVFFLAIFEEDDIDYGSFKSYDSLVKKIKNLDCGDQTTCEDYHYLYLKGKNDILFFNKTHPTPFSNLPSSLRCGHKVGWFHDSDLLFAEDTLTELIEKPKVCGDSSCVCFNDECFEQSKLENVNLKFDFSGNFFNLALGKDTTSLNLMTSEENDFSELYDGYEDQDSNMLILGLSRQRLGDFRGLINLHNFVDNVFCENEDRFLLFVKIVIKKTNDDIDLALSEGSAEERHPTVVIFS